MVGIKVGDGGVTQLTAAGWRRFEADVDRLTRTQLPFAVAKTLTALAVETKRETVAQMQARFDRPKPWTLNSLFVQGANKNDGFRMTALVNVMDGNGQRRYAAQGHEGMGAAFVASGQDKRAIIGQQFTGGGRQWKRFEKRLQRAGILPSGLVAVPPKQGNWAMPIDRYGNAPHGLLVKILSYFEAFSEAGSAGNTTAAGRAKIAKTRQRKGHDYTRISAAGKKIKRSYIEIGGVVYFISRGKGSPSADGRLTQPLARGIWAKRGIHGVEVAPVLLFVREPYYTARIDLPGIASRLHREKFGALLRANLAGAIRTAR